MLNGTGLPMKDHQPGSTAVCQRILGDLLFWQFKIKIARLQSYVLQSTTDSLLCRLQSYLSIVL